MHPEPLATYRLQLRPGFGLKEANDIVYYLKELGISHIYTSPYLQAVTDSTHGYDVVDPTKINAQLGTEELHEHFCETIKTAGMGLMIDIVPNHMAIVGKQNPWWWDVLENGPSSPFAVYFDVDWEASEERWPNKVLLPVLGDHYGRILESGQLKLSFLNGSIILHYQDHSFPVDPSSLPEFLSRVAESSHSELLAFLAESHARLPRPTVTSIREVQRRHRDKAVLFNLLIRLCHDEPNLTAAINAEIGRLNHHSDGLDALIDKQNYRLAFWRTASRDLGYRRFFDIKELIGLKIENLEVFRATHALPIIWFKKGWVQGLRIDHPDGLRNPQEYFNRLQEACPGAWTVAEKILEPGEKLPSNWQVAGTTGYDFLNLLGELFIDQKGKEPLTNLYQDIIGKQTNFKELVYECKLLVLTDLFGSEVNRLTTLFVTVCEKHRRYRDYTRFELKAALCEVAACFPVYRSYVSFSEKLVSEDDKNFINLSINLALSKRPDLDPELFHFLNDLLLLKIEGELEGELAMRFQQLTGPAMAKGFEDTSLYRYHRLIALNEVGGDPSWFGVSISQFHETCVTAQKHRPLSLLASTTHDTKRSEDFRARIALLSEIPEMWGHVVQKWIALNELHRIKEIPDRNTEYLFYQTLVGAWPIDEERVKAYMQKAVREAKEYTSWIKTNEEYEVGVANFITEVMHDQIFINDFKNFIEKLIEPGRVNSLAQVLIKLTAPGIPDIFQGSELWNLSLVDPDNRREVDYNLRRLLLEEMKDLSSKQVLDKMDEGLPKLWVIQKTLHLRKAHPEIFGSKGTYKPLYAKGQKSNHIVAFIRGETILTVTPRLIFNLNHDWADTVLELPEGIWINIFTGEKLKGGLVPIQKLFENFPVGLLQHEKEHG